MAVINGPANGGAWVPGTANDDTINLYGNGNSSYGYGGTNYIYARGGNENNLVGGPGIDHLDGGTGVHNLASYQLSSGPVTASLANPAINTGDAAGDTYVNLRDLTGSTHGGSYYADNSGLPNQLWALGGTNYLYGGTGYTTFISGPGADHMVGGSGGGFADYEASHAGVTASLANSAINTGEAAGDTYSGIRNLGGSGYDDVLYLDNSGGNVLAGAGNDVVHGGAGNDTLNGGPGANTFYGGVGTDWFIFGGSAIGPGDINLDPLTILSDARQGIYSTIVDFDQSSGHFETTEYDSIDVAPLLSSLYNRGNGPAVSSMVRLQEDSTNSFAVLQVDTTGTGSNWLTLAHLSGVPGNASIQVILDESMSSGVTLTVQPAPGMQPPGMGVSKFIGTGGLHADFNADLHTDLAWRNDSGGVEIWMMNGTVKYADQFVSGMGNDWKLAALADTGGDGKSDFIWRNDFGNVAIWQMDGTSKIADQSLNQGTDWKFADAADFNGDGKADILWRNDFGAIAIWELNGGTKIADQSLNQGRDWSIADTADFNGDGKADILWRNDFGAVALWTMDGTQKTGDVSFNQGLDWNFAATADFNGDGKADILWRNDFGAVALWIMDGTQKIGDVSFNQGTDWNFQGIGDFNGDGKADILWRNDYGAVSIWLMNGSQRIGDVSFNQGTDWRFGEIGDVNGDGRSDIVWRHDGGDVSVWEMNGTQKIADVVVSHMGTDWHLV